MPLLFQPRLLCAGKRELLEALHQNITPESSLEPIEWESSPYVQAPVLRMFSAQSSDVETRLKAIIALQRQTLAQFSHKAPCIVLLPELTDSHALAGVVRELKQAFSPMQSDFPITVYPYGHAAFIMALRRIQALSTQYKQQGVWLIGVDTAEAFCQQQACVKQSIALSDSLFVTQVHANANGLEPVWHQVDAVTGNKTRAESIRFLFRASAQVASKPFSALYLPFGGSAQYENDWGSEFHFLSEKVPQSTEHLFVDYQVGDLGVNLALFKVLSLANRRRHFPEEPLCGLQLDVANKKYLGAAIFDWRN